jgi:hypothetical protein
MQLEYNVMAYIAMELVRYVAVHDKIQLLESGVENMVHGQLTPVGWSMPIR